MAAKPKVSWTVKGQAGVEKDSDQTKGLVAKKALEVARVSEARAVAVEAPARTVDKVAVAQR
jgi:hypothetical protein